MTRGDIFGYEMMMWEMSKRKKLTNYQLIDFLLKVCDMNVTFTNVCMHTNTN